MYFIFSLNRSWLITVITQFQPKMHPHGFNSGGENKEVFWTQSCGYSKCLLVWNLLSSQMDLSLTAGHSQQRPSPRPWGFRTTSGRSLLRMAGHSWTRCDSCLVNRNCCLSHSWIRLKPEEPQMVPISDFMGTERRVSAGKTFTVSIWVRCHWWKESQNTRGPVEWVRKDEKKKLKLHATTICSAQHQKKKRATLDSSKLCGKTIKYWRTKVQMASDKCASPPFCSMQA